MERKNRRLVNFKNIHRLNRDGRQVLKVKIFQLSINGTYKQINLILDLFNVY